MPPLIRPAPPATFSRKREKGRAHRERKIWDAPSFSRSREKVARACGADEGSNQRDANQDLNLDLSRLFRPLEQSRGLLLAVSGGPDSTALLLLIDRWRQKIVVPVFVATVDHVMRPGSLAEAQAVARLCAARGLPHTTLVRTGPPPKTRIQERLREVRYDLLCAHAAAVGADTVVTGHHADDQAETILMRLLRGSGPAGLAGMAPVSRRGDLAIARPLLDLSKRDLMALCQAEGAPFAEDPSNTAPDFRRTEIRSLLARLETEGLSAESLLRLARRSARAEDALAGAAEQAGKDLCTREASRSILPAGPFRLLPEEIRLRLLGAEIARIGQRPYRLERLEPLAEALDKALEVQADFAATLGGCTVRHRADKVIIALAPPRRGRR